ncbi:alcohol dehydrogenase catalytic domain-containing protein [Paucilactobacillus nenjiangensis]|uniref:alcohol dehydrogenase catalytic domain-containing protein n=1 Tax=Paucilactobacillus nenjiangensis TaxID=1296540 RepID=UPI0010F757C7|nr:hypothetical protein [Paucilactobacillus nenjiangensis]
MKAVIVDGNRHLVDTDLQMPIISGHDVLVKIHSISINPIDIKRIQRITSTDSRVLGYDAIGEVLAIGVGLE